MAGLPLYGLNAFHPAWGMLDKLKALLVNDVIWDGVLGHISPSHPQNGHAESAQTGLQKDPTHVKLPQHHVCNPPSPRKHQRSEKL